MTAVGPRQPRPNSRSYASVDISTAASGLSDAINLTGLTLSSIQMSTAWTSARLGFLGNCDGSTNYYETHQSTVDDGSTAARAITWLTTANRLLVFDPKLFHGLQSLQLVSVATGSTAAAAQAATRTIILGLSEITKKS